eukprot:gene3947-4570_t
MKKKVNNGILQIECPVCRENFDGFIANKIANRIFETSKKYYSSTKVMEKQIDNHNGSYEKHQDELRKKDADKVDLEEKVKELEDTTQRSEQELRDLKSQLRELSLQRSSEANQHQETLGQYILQVQELQVNNSKLSDSYNNQLTLSRQMEERNNQLTSQTRDMSAQLQQLESRVSQTSREKQALGERASDTETRLRGLESTLQDKDRRIDQLQQEVDTLKRRSDRERVHFESSKDEHSKMTEKVVKLENIIADLGFERSKYEIDLETIRSRCRALEKEAEESRLKVVVPTKTDYIGELFKKTTTISSFFSKQPQNDFISSFKGTSDSGISYYSYVPSDQDLVVFRETMLLSKLDHPNLLRVERITKDDSGRIYAILSPFVSNDLEYVLLNRKSSPISMSDIKFIAYQLISVVHYLHSQDLVHRDIKPTSILLYEDRQLKLCSFNLCGSVLSSESSGLGIPNTFSNYSSPELLLNSGISQRRLDWKAADMWCIGRILADLVLGRSLFTGNVRMDLLKQICNFNECAPTDPKYFIGQSIDIRFNPSVSIFGATPTQSHGRDTMDLITKLLKFEPSSRISAKDAIQHPLFSKEPFYNPTEHYPYVASTLTDRNIKDFVKDKCAGII